MAWIIEQEREGRWLAIGAYPSEEEAREHASALRSLMRMGRTPDAAVRLVPPMSAEEYRSLRESLGTQDAVATMLGVHRVTIARREAGDPRYPIDREAELAIRHLTERG